MATSATTDELPNFISTFRATPFFYFHHIINAEEAALTVEVIGPNLTYTFHHSKAKDVLNASTIAARLEQKTVGFLTLVKNSDRHILTWAESGHGCGKFGDYLEIQPRGPLLANTLWTRRVIYLGSLLGFKMARPFDQVGNSTAKDGLVGVFQGAHVEVKLAVFAVCLMLQYFEIAKDMERITRGQLKRLRHARFQDGSRPAFEIYFSKKNCASCGNLIGALADITGMEMTLCWKDRLTKKVYNKGRTRREIARARRHAIVIEDDQAADIPERIEIEDDSDDESVATIPNAVEPAIMLDGDDSGDSTMVDLTAPSHSPEVEAEPVTRATSGVNDFVEGLHAHNAVLDQTWRQSRIVSQHKDKNILKPLPPAKEETEDPFNSGPDRVPTQRRAQTSLCPPPRASSSQRRTPIQRARTTVRERSPRRYSLQPREKTAYPTPTKSPTKESKNKGEEVLKPSPTRDAGRTRRKSSIRVEIPARRRSRSPSLFDF